MKERAKLILRWSEKYTKTDMTYLAKGGFWLFFGQAAATLTSFLSAYIFANYLDKTTYGTYRFAFSISAIIGIFSLTGFGISLIRSASRGYDGSLKHAYEKSLKWHFLVVIISVIGAGYYFYQENYGLAFSYIVIGFTIPFVNSASFHNAFLSGKKLFKESGIYWVMGNTVAVGAAVITAVLTKNPYAMIGAYFITNAITQYLIFKEVVQKFTQNDDIENGSLRYGFHLSAMGALDTLANHLDKALLFHYLGAAEVALFYFALAIPDQMKGVFKSVTRLALPKFAEKELQTVMVGLYGKIARYGVLVIFSTIAYIVAAPYIFKWFFPAYIDMVGYSQILSVASVMIIGTIPIAVLQANAKKEYLYANSFLVSGTQIILTFFFIRSYGLKGAVIAYLCNRTISLIVPLGLLYVAHRKSLGDQKSLPQTND
jgi:O-antigen/teichoic acid export membrane protein